MSLSPGTKLGPYEIVSPLGAGGMGEVWKARDERLDRFVAIKVLPEHFSSDAEFLSRFEREAKAVAALSHPNILALHDLGREGETRYAVMELLEGETLRSRLAKGPLAPRRAIELSVQLAQGLAAAHEKGVIHRDLKPDNIWITKDGRLKILDFGLAKMLVRKEAALDSQLPTEGIGSGGAASTGKGTILGTVGYMSPEQVRGEVVDHRSDLFSFGAVLFEMLSGQRAFARDSATETLASILRDDPPALASSAAQPISAALERIVLHCLEKSADGRFQSARDIAFALENLGESGGQPASFSAPFAKANRAASWKWAGLVALLLLVAGFVGWLLRGGRPPEPAFHRLTFRLGTVENARFAADGKTVVYSARWKGGEPALHSIPSGSIESQALPIGTSTLVAVSRSNELAILLEPRLTYGFYPGRLATVPMSGGGPREILANVNGADWNPESGELAAIRFENARWVLESPPGKVLRSAKGLAFPRYAPHGGRIAFYEKWNGLGWPLLPEAGDVMVLEPSGEARILAKGRRCTGLAWSPSGDEIWFSEWLEGSRTALVAVSLAGRARPLWSGPGNLEIQDVAPDGRVMLVAQNLRHGFLVLGANETRERDLSLFDGSVATDITADGRTLLVTERGAGGGESGTVLLCPVDGSPPTRLGTGWSEAFSPDERFVLASVPDRLDRLALIPTTAGATRYVEMPGYENNQLSRFFPDGRRILFQGTKAGERMRIFEADLGGGMPRPLTVEGSVIWKGAAALSPDGSRFFVHHDSDDGGSDEFISTVDGSAPPFPRRSLRDIPIRWTADGRGIYFFSRDELPVRVRKLDLASGREELVKELMPADPGGITGISSIVMTADATVFAFNYRRRISELYVVDGLQ